MNIVLIGAPGSGKGTQAKLLTYNFKLHHFSLGEELRFEIKQDTDIGKLAKSYIDKGQLVPDDVALQICKKHVLNNIIFDGFPRNVNQLNLLAELTDLDEIVFLYFDILKDKLIQRLLNRRVCTNCGNITNTLIEEITQCKACRRYHCSCGGDLITRDDDNEETIIKRFEVFENETKPILNYISYKTIDADKTIDEVFNNIKEQLYE